MDRNQASTGEKKMIKFSYHKDCIGKPEKREIDGKQTLWVGNKRINLGYGWITTELKLEEIYELLTVDGLAFSPALSSDHRISANFTSHELALVDIDDGMTLDELQNFRFYQLYGSGYYTTASHTDEEPRFRILYRLPVAITEAETMRIIYEGLLAVHGAADISCKDAVRLFYGTVNAKHRELTDKMIDAEGLEILVKARDIVLEQTHKDIKVIDNNVEFEPKTIEQVAELLDELRKHYSNLNYGIRRDVTWAVAGTIGNVATIELMRTRWNDSEKTMKYESFINDRKRTSLTMGTIYHMIRQYNPEFGKQIKTKDDWRTRRRLLADKYV